LIRFIQDFTFDQKFECAQDHKRSKDNQRNQPITLYDENSIADQHDDGCHSKVADYQAQSQGGPQTGLAEKLYGLVYLRVMPTRQADQVRQPGMREGRFGG